MRRILTTTAVATLLAAQPAFANEFEPAMRSMLENEVAIWLSDPVLVEAIKSQNASTKGYDDAKITTLDQEWRAEVGTGNTPMIDLVLGNAAADYLRGKRDEAGGLITEIFIMDSVGLNVAASDVTSDYWQGDEDKWQQTYAKGSEGVHISEVELDESTQEYQSQLSVSIVDPATGDPIGAATIGVNVGLLE